uniref:Uncharacterized protein n=1 Tax=Romanomermis culicivorax TaxID=13658 RepID=A0A915HQ76_ROMCU
MRHCATAEQDSDQRKLLFQTIERFFYTNYNPNRALICLSVRTIFDLYFRVKHFESGSLVVLSAVNIPAMTEIVEKHGLVPVPWDVDPLTLAPDVEQLRILLRGSDKIVAIVLAHIFGKRCDVEPYLKVLQSQNSRRKIDFIEDCAEIFNGFDYLGHPDSDLAMFSFGVIKFASCFGGAVAKVKSQFLYDKLAQLHNNYPIVPRTEYLAKLCKFQMLAFALNYPNVTYYGSKVLKRFNIDYKAKASGMLQAFPTDMFRLIRRQPCSAMLNLMIRRFETIADPQTFRMTKDKGDYVTKILLSSSNLIVPGYLCKFSNYWLYPVIVKCDPATFVRDLEVQGVDAYTNASRLSVAEPNADVCRIFPGLLVEKARCLKHLVYLPVHKNVPYEYLDLICSAVLLCCAKNNMLSVKSRL